LKYKKSRIITIKMDNPNPGDINLTDLPPEILLIILEILLTIDPITLLGSVPGVCRRMRALCSGVLGEFDMSPEWGLGEWGRMDQRNEWGRGEWSRLKGALASASIHFPRIRGLWTFSKWPLHDAREAGLTVATERLLVEKGGDLNKEGYHGYTPLLNACEYGHVDVVRLLAEKGADLNRTGNIGWTPLDIARIQGHDEIVAFLEQAGARE
tara:strand:- start:433 stop:1065 length:633 start_codon:yes stop_codon:yes gene_type:complete